MKKELEYAVQTIPETRGNGQYNRMHNWQEIYEAMLENPGMAIFVPLKGQSIASLRHGGKVALTNRADCSKYWLKTATKEDGVSFWLSKR